MRRKLRVLTGEWFIEVGQFIIESGKIVRDFGGFVLPSYERHPAFRSNDDLDF
jgi:hypothetical protein